MERPPRRGTDDLYRVFPENLLMTLIHHQCPGGMELVGSHQPVRGGTSPQTPTEHERGREDPATEIAHPPGRLHPLWVRPQRADDLPTHSRTASNRWTWAASFPLATLDATNLTGLSLGNR